MWGDSRRRNRRERWRKQQQPPPIRRRRCPPEISSTPTRARRCSLLDEGGGLSSVVMVCGSCRRGVGVFSMGGGCRWLSIAPGRGGGVLSWMRAAASLRWWCSDHVAGRLFYQVDKQQPPTGAAATAARASEYMPPPPYPV